MKIRGLLRTLAAVTAAAWFGGAALQPAAWAAASTPRLEYTQIGNLLERPGGGFSPNAYDPLEGLYLQAQLLGLNPGETVNAVTQMAGNAPMVLGRYDAASGRLVVEIYKVERTVSPSGAATGVYRAFFTPAHGQLWANAGTYKAPHASAPGADPFAQFADGSAPNTFQNASFEAAEVIMGHAMRYVGSPIGVLAVIVPKTSQVMETTRDSYGYLRKTVRITPSTKLETKWYVAAPPSFQSSGTSAAICLNAAGCGPTPYLVAPAMVTFQEWKGGTMPNVPTVADEVTHSEITQESHFVFDRFLAAVNVYTFATSGMQRIGAGGNVGGVVAGLLGAGPNASLQLDYNARALYEGLTALHANRSFSEVQAAYGAHARNGVLTGPSHGNVAQQVSTTSQTRMLADPLTTSGSIRSYYVGDCDVSKTIAECGSQPSGVVPRADTYVEFDILRFYDDPQGR